ncbi:MAG: prepilin peptidase [Lachnospiraceae bacterium]|nr:prepilin peptidase [Lachnospiraceae bacterium]
MLLVYLSYEDIRTHKISTHVLLMGFVLAIISLIWGRALPVGEYLAGGALGICFIALSVASKEIGMGDGVLLMILGLMLGIRRLISILFAALILCAAAAAVLCLLGKAKRTSRLPFVPFLLGGFWMTI